MPAAIWFTGLPGSGKSALARAVCHYLTLAGGDVALLELDDRRKAYFPKPSYSEGEREKAYKLFAEEAAGLYRQKTGLVVLDASAPRRAMRDYARSLMPHFAEIHVRCSLATAMAREAARPEGKVMAGLYAKAMMRKATGRDFPGLGQVIGVDVPFEEDPAAECVVDAERLSIEEGRDLVLAFLRAWPPVWEQ
ncbi:adenylyl-sulfate kinase [Solidesulfovibrio magneticus]|uniref:Adenylylsulfate kinase n=1 Tax=Solidesulfovibrio magneticus (strain ATCC 700980 / DSM 13731 / RS-1) TaxID=573370 RepID=C4XQ54_SOLM1|nr:adenylyl-sulfate kinase [Solidesulfovibrio magneticus]BAH75219.1 putative adenylylsulfate kinase [Solidesulfovibrio magneticus RS-1]